MPRFYFHVHDSQGLLLKDSEGLEFPDVESAREEFGTIVQSVLNETEEFDHLGKDFEFHVVDEQGSTVVVVPFGALALSSSFPARPRTK